MSRDVPDSFRSPAFLKEIAMTKLLMIRVALAVSLVAVLGQTASASDEQADKAKALLALSKAKGARAATAPAPHAPAPKDYATGYKAATADQVPLVVFVGCDVKPTAGAVACKCDAPSFGEAKAPAVVVGYPVGEKLMVDTTIKGQGTEAELKRAVEKAARKIGDIPAKPMPAPAPADWQIRGDDEPDEQPIAFRRGKGSCACGDKCPCADVAKVESQPAEAKPVAAPAPVVTYQYVTYRDQRGRTWTQIEPVGSPAVTYSAPSCAGGSCTPATSYSFPGATYISGSPCANGRCPTSR